MCEFPRSWLLPVMRDHVRETEMMFFFENLAPLANTLKGKGKQLNICLYYFYIDKNNEQFYNCF